MTKEPVCVSVRLVGPAGWQIHDMFEGTLRAQLVREIKIRDVKKFFGEPCMIEVVVPFGSSLHPAAAIHQIKCDLFVSSMKYDLSLYFDPGTKESSCLRTLFKEFEMSEMRILRSPEGSLPLLGVVEQVSMLTRTVSRIDETLDETKSELERLREEFENFKQETEDYKRVTGEKIEELRKRDKKRDRSPK